MFMHLHTLHRTWRRLLSGALLCILCAPSEVTAQTPLDWAHLEEVAHRSFAQDHARQFDVELKSLSAQRDAVPHRVLDVHMTGIAQAPLTSSARGASQQQIQAGTTLMLGRLPTLMSEVLDVQREHELAVQDLKKMQYFQELLSAYGEWWRASLVLAHLGEDIEDAKHHIEPLRASYEAGTFAALDWLDLEVEIAAMQSEHAMIQQARSSALGQLERLLDVTSWVPMVGDEEFAIAHAENPWRALSALLDAHPTIQALHKERELLEARSEVELRRTPPAVAFDVGWTSVGGGAQWSLLQASIVLPLSNPGKAEAIRLRMQASSLEYERLWQLERLNRAMGAYEREYDDLVEVLRAVDDGEMERLEVRQQALEQAFAQGHIPLVRVLKGRRASHEAHHRRLLLLLELHTSALRAQLMRSWLSS
jgi:outer membrane protein TolC